MKSTLNRRNFIKTGLIFVPSAYAGHIVQHRRKAFRGSGSSIVTPDTITGLGLWLKSDTGTYQTSGGSAASADTDPVGEWQDLSGNARHLTQATSGNRPKISTSVLFNGIKTVFFDNSSSNRFDIPNFLSGVFTAAEIFIVAKLGTENSQGGLWWFGSTGSSSHFQYSDGNIYEDFGTTSRKTVGNPTPNLSTSAFCYNVTSKSGGFSARLNGTSLFSTATNTVGWSTAPRLGANNVGNHLNMNVAELILYNKELNSTERDSIEAYLADRYALTIA